MNANNGPQLVVTFAPLSWQEWVEMLLIQHGIKRREAHREAIDLVSTARHITGWLDFCYQVAGKDNFLEHQANWWAAKVDAILEEREYDRVTNLLALIDQGFQRVRVRHSSDQSEGLIVRRLNSLNLPQTTYRVWFPETDDYYILYEEELEFL